MIALKIKFKMFGRQTRAKISLPNLPAIDRGTSSRSFCCWFLMERICMMLNYATLCQQFQLQRIYTMLNFKFVIKSNYVYRLPRGPKSPTSHTNNKNLKFRIWTFPGQIVLQSLDGGLFLSLGQYTTILVKTYSQMMFHWRMINHR